MRAPASLRVAALSRAAFRPPLGPAIVVGAVVILLGCAFVASYSLVLGRPKPRRIATALVADRSPDRALIQRIERSAGSALALRRYPSVAAARRAIAHQHVYAALIFGPRTGPRLVVASAAGASVARVLERAAQTTVVSGDRPLRVVDARPLPAGDPSGVDAFYVALAATILGFVSMFQLRANARGLSLRAWLAFATVLGTLVGLALACVSGPIINALGGSLPEKWAILTLEFLAAAFVNSTLLALVHRWAIIPTWTLFVVLGNTSSGGAVAPPLLPPVYEFLGRWLPPGAAVSALRNAVYFPHAERVEPFLVLGSWVAAGLAALVLTCRLSGRTPGLPV